VKTLETEANASSSLAELHLTVHASGLRTESAAMRIVRYRGRLSEHLHSIEAGLQGAAIRLAEARNELTAADEAERKKSQSIAELRISVRDWMRHSKKLGPSARRSKAQPLTSE